MADLRKRMKILRMAFVAIPIAWVIVALWQSRTVSEESVAVKYRPLPARQEGYRMVDLPLTQVWLYLFETSDPPPLRWSQLQGLSAKIDVEIDFERMSRSGNAKAECWLAQTTGSAEVDAVVIQWCTNVSQQLEYKAIGRGTWKLRVELNGLTRSSSVRYVSCGRGLKPEAGCVRYCISDKPQFNIDVFPFPKPRVVSNVELPDNMCDSC